MLAGTGSQHKECCVCNSRLSKTNASIQHKKEKRQGIKYRGERVDRNKFAEPNMLQNSSPCNQFESLASNSDAKGLKTYFCPPGCFFPLSPLLSRVFLLQRERLETFTQGAGNLVEQTANGRGKEIAPFSLFCYCPGCSRGFSNFPKQIFRGCRGELAKMASATSVSERSCE